MKNIEIACYALIASAFILAGLLMFNMRHALEQQAKADLVVNRQNFTVMTALTKDGEESVFVLDNVTSRLLVYSLNVQRKSLELVANEDISRQFGFNDNKPGGTRR